MFVPVIEVGEHVVIEVDKRTSWLCHVVAGKSRGTGPLARTDVLEMLGQLRDAQDTAEVAPPPLADGMAGFGLDDDPAVSPALAPRGPRKRGPPRVVEVDLPPRLRGNGVSAVKCLSSAPHGRRCKSLFLCKEYIPWLVHILDRQVKEGGVTFQPSECVLTKPWFNVKRGAWQCRARSPRGRVHRRFVAVPLRATGEVGARALGVAEYAEVKKGKLAELLRWQQGAQDGSIHLG